MGAIISELDQLKLEIKDIKTEYKRIRRNQNITMCLELGIAILLILNLI